MTPAARRPLGRALAAVLAAALAGCAATAPGPGSGGGIQLGRAASPGAVPPEFLGAVEIPSGTTFAGTVVGGLSGLAYDAAGGVLYAISDDDGERSPARFYALAIDLDDGRLDPQDVAVAGVTFLADVDGRPFPLDRLDGEGIALAPPAAGGGLYVASEGRIEEGVPPELLRFGLDGRLRQEIPLLPHFLPGSSSGSLQDRGARHNLAFESLTVSPDAGLIVTAVENALAQDGPAADVGIGSPARVLGIDPTTAAPVGEWVYPVGPVDPPPLELGVFRVNGLVDLLALDRRRFLALERSYAFGAGMGVRLYETELAEEAGAVGGSAPSLPLAVKRPLLDLGSVGPPLDNYEGMALGPRLPDGRASLLIVADDNFATVGQRTVFLAFALPAGLVPGREGDLP